MPRYGIWKLLILATIIALCFLLIWDYKITQHTKITWISEILIEKLNAPFRRTGTITNGLLKAKLKTTLHNQIEQCNFPKLNPWDPTLDIECPIKRSCKKIQSYLTFVDKDGYLTLNQSEINHEETVAGSNSTWLNCTYRFLDMPANISDDEIIYDKFEPLTTPVKFKTDTAQVTCGASFEDGFTNKNSYLNMHAFPANFDERMKSKPTESRLSVLMLGLDSVSFSELRRYMPSTYEYVRETMGMFMFRKMNKVGFNSYPNLMAMMLGGVDGTPERTDPLKNDRFDSVPFLWKDFAAKNYTTVFNEDFTDWGFFHYGAKGFTRKPFDFYYRPFWLATVRKPMSDVSDRYCLANMPTSEVHLGITKNHVVRMNQALQFVLAFFTAFTHNFDNDAGELDKFYRAFFEEMFENHHFNKTVVIFFSDHGHRFHKRRKALVGALEEHNPMLGIWFPEWFYKLHPQLKQNLGSNINRYSSTYDLHETLIDIVNENYEGKQKTHEWPGRSLLYELPLSRTCKEAGVPENYCLCSGEVAIELDAESSILLNRISRIVTDHLNFVLAHLKLCLIIEPVSIIRASLMDLNAKVAVPSQSSMNRIKNAQKLRLAIETQPNGAQFEALLEKKDVTSLENWAVIGDVERINAYGNSSMCIENTKLRAYCTC